jgi:hypothetical protein
MDFLISLFTDPKVLSVLTFPIVVAGALAFALWKLFQKYDGLQEQRLNEWQNMVNDYNTLVTDINNTLDTVLKVINKNNGSGGGK